MQMRTKGTIRNRVFDTIDYGQEDYEFGDSDSDARHWDKFLLNIFENEEYAGVLSGLFNQN